MHTCLVMLPPVPPVQDYDELWGLLPDSVVDRALHTFHCALATLLSRHSGYQVCMGPLGVCIGHAPYKGSSMPTIPAAS